MESCAFACADGAYRIEKTGGCLRSKGLLETDSALDLDDSPFSCYTESAVAGVTQW